jgi:hypothetical protein
MENLLPAIQTDLFASCRLQCGPTRAQGRNGGIARLGNSKCAVAALRLRRLCYSPFRSYATSSILFPNPRIHCACVAPCAGKPHSTPLPQNKDPLDLETPSTQTEPPTPRPPLCAHYPLFTCSFQPQGLALCPSLAFTCFFQCCFVDRRPRHVRLRSE